MVPFSSLSVSSSAHVKCLGLYRMALYRISYNFLCPARLQQVPSCVSDDEAIGPAIVFHRRTTVLPTRHSPSQLISASNSPDDSTDADAGRCVARLK